MVVYNPLNIRARRRGGSRGRVPGGTPKAVRVDGPDGKEVPAQIEGGKVLFLAKVPSVGYAVYDVQPAPRAASERSTLKVTAVVARERALPRAPRRRTATSEHLRQELNKELLSAPVRLAITTDAPRQWPAWNMDFDDQQRAPRAYVGGPAKVRIVENGPARVALEVTRETEGSKFVQTVRLSAGDAGNRVEIANAIDWKTWRPTSRPSFRWPRPTGWPPTTGTSAPSSGRPPKSGSSKSPRTSGST